MILKATKYKYILSFIFSVFGIAFFLFWVFFVFRYELYDTILDGSILFGLLFYSLFVLILFQESVYFFHKPTLIEMDNRFMYLDLPLAEKTYLSEEIKGFSKTIFSTRSRTYDIIILYLHAGNTYEFWSNWYNITELNTLLNDSKYEFLGEEKHEYKYLWIFKKKYKYL